MNLPMNKPSQLEELEQIDLNSLGVSELKSLLNQSIQVTTRFIAFLAKVWKALEDKGEDLSDLRHGLMRYLPLVSAGKMDASLLIQFAGQQLLLRELALLPTEEQCRLANGEKIPLVTKTNEGFSTKLVDLANLHSRYYPQIFTVGRVRTEAEQMAMLDASKPKRRQQKIRKKNVIIDQQKGAIKCGTTSILIDDVLSALAKVSGKSSAELSEYLGLAVEQKS